MVDQNKNRITVTNVIDTVGRINADGTVSVVSRQAEPHDLPPEVPEVVGELRELHQAVVDNYVNGSDAKLCALINILARHHERGEQS